MSSIPVLSHVWRNRAELRLFKECVARPDDETRRRIVGHGDIAMTRRHEAEAEEERGIQGTTKALEGMPISMV